MTVSDREQARAISRRFAALSAFACRSVDASAMQLPSVKRPNAAIQRFAMASKRISTAASNTAMPSGG